jgi:adenylosuccinate synthase
MRRHLTSPHRIFAADLMNKPLYRQKLQSVRAWYGSSLDDCSWDEINHEMDFEIFDWVNLVPTWTVTNMFKTLVFEGAQGIMLDQDHGFFPHVTYGHTTVKNAMSLLPPGQEATIQYVTRSYQTRHGDGPMGNGEALEGLDDTTNHDRGHQGSFRTARLDFDMLAYAFMVNEGYSDIRIAKRTLNVTCCDRLEPDYDALKAIFPIGKRFAFHSGERLSLGIEF